MISVKKSISMKMFCETTNRYLEMTPSYGTDPDLGVASKPLF